MIGNVFGLSGTGQFRTAAVGYMPDHCFWLLLQVSMPPFKMVTVVIHYSYMIGSEGFNS